MRKGRTLLAGGAVVIGAGAIVAVALLPRDAATTATRPAADGTRRWLEDLLEASQDDAFQRPSGPWRLSLPEDHGGHAGARAETWMIAAHLQDEAGRAVGMNFSLTRFGLRAEDRDPAANPWTVRSLYRAHATVALEGGPAEIAEERFSRGAGAAGHDNLAWRAWLDDWRLDWGEGPEAPLTLTTRVDGFFVRLVMRPDKPAIQADPVGDLPARAFAITRLEVEGAVGADRRRVSGQAWLERIWGEVPPPGGPIARARLLVQLDDGADLSLVRSARRDRVGVATVDGVLVDAAGVAATLSDDAVLMQPARRRAPEASGDAYPVAWQVSGGGLDLQVRPVLDDGAGGSALASWIGAVRVEGMRDGAPVAGRGTLLLTGYDER